MTEPVAPPLPSDSSDPNAALLGGPMDSPKDAPRATTAGFEGKLWSGEPSVELVVLAWLLLIPVNVVLSLARGGLRGSVRVWLAAHAAGAGHLLLCGLLSALVLVFFRLVAERHTGRAARWALFGVASAALGWFVAGPDFSGFLARVAPETRLPPGVLGAVATAIAALGCAVVGTLVPRRFAPILLVPALILQVANNIVLELDYPGIHFVLGWSAALLLTFAFKIDRPAWLPPASKTRVGVLALVPLAVVALFVHPSEAAWRKLLESSGQFATPYVADLMPEFGADGDGATDSDEWTKSRAGRPPTPPSGLSGLPEDGIVMLVVMDALRADVVDSEHPKVPTPNLDKLRKRAVEFTMARSAAPSTLSSITSVFTGKYYSQLHAPKSKDTRDEDVSEDPSPRVAELLAQASIPSFHVVPTRLLAPEKGATRGFEVVSLKEKAPSSKVLPQLERRIEQGVNGRLFVYLHWMDAHAPYDLGGKQGTPYEAYLREVKILDRRFGELLRLLEKRDLTSRTTLIVTGDHGEAFGEHGTWEHGKTVYEELLRVPLLIAAPGQRKRTVETPVSLIDVGATVLDLFGQPTPGHWMGESLLPIMARKKKSISHPIAAEAGRRLRAFFPKSDVKVVFDRRRKTTELYNLTKDPTETNNIADDAVVKGQVQKARRFWKAHEVTD